MHLGPGNLASIDRFSDFKIGVWLERSSGANRGYAASQVEPRKTVRHFAERARSNGIKHVVVHADEARDDRVSLQVEDLGVFRHVGGRGIAKRFNLSFT